MHAESRRARSRCPRSRSVGTPVSSPPSSRSSSETTPAARPPALRPVFAQCHRSPSRRSDSTRHALTLRGKAIRCQGACRILRDRGRPMRVGKLSRCCFFYKSVEIVPGFIILSIGSHEDGTAHGVVPDHPELILTPRGDASMTPTFCAGWPPS